MYRMLLLKNFQPDTGEGRGPSFVGPLPCRPCQGAFRRERVRVPLCQNYRILTGYLYIENLYMKNINLVCQNLR